MNKAYLGDDFRINQLNQILQLSSDARRLGLYILQDNDEYKPLFSEIVSGKYDDYKLTWDEVKAILLPYFDTEEKSLWVGDYYSVLEIITGKETAPILKTAFERLEVTPEYKGNGFTTCRSFYSLAVYTNMAVKLLKGIGSYLSEPKPILDYATSCYDFDTDAFFTISLILSVELDNKNCKLEKYLFDCINKDKQLTWHPIHLRSLLASSSSSCWDVVIKRCAGYPDDDNFIGSAVGSLAFSSMGAMPAFLKMVLEAELYLHTDVLEAFDKWTGLKWIDYTSAPNLVDFISYAIVLFEKIIEKDNLEVVEKLLTKNSEDWKVLVILWVAVFTERGACERLIEGLMGQENQESKAVGFYFFSLVAHNRHFQKLALEQLQNSDDIRVLYWAVRNLRVYSLGSHEGVFEILIKAMDKLPQYAVDVPFSSLPVAICARGRCAAGKHLIYSLFNTLFEKYPENMEKFLPYFSQVTPVNIRLQFAQTMQHYFFNDESNEKKGFASYQHTMIELLSSDKNNEIREIGYKIMDIDILIKHYRDFFEIIASRVPADRRENLWGIIEKWVKDVMENEDFHPDYFIEALFDEFTSMDRNDLWLMMQADIDDHDQFGWQADAIIRTQGLEDKYDSSNISDLFDEIQEFSNWLDSRGLAFLQLDNGVSFLGFVIKKNEVNKVLEVAKKALLDVYLVTHLERWGKVGVEYSGLYE